MTASTDMPGNSDCLRAAFSDGTVLLILTRTVSDDHNVRRWIVTMDGEPAGIIRHHNVTGWLAEPNSPASPKRARSWQDAARYTARASAARQPAKLRPAPERALRLVYSAT